MSFRFPTPRLPTRRQTNPFYLPSSTDHVIDALLHLSSCLVSSRYPPTSVRLCTTLRLIIITPNTGCRRASPLNPSSCFLSYLFPLLSLPTFLRRLQLRTRLCRHPLPSLTQSTTDLVGYIPVPVTPNNLNQFPASPPPPDSDSFYSLFALLIPSAAQGRGAVCFCISRCGILLPPIPPPLFVTLSR